LNKYTEEEIIKSLEKLGFWFNKDENQNYGLNDHIEESGSNLTLAEKSMIAVTKLLLKKYNSVIILEDLSSCLDIKTQKIVYEAIYNTFPESTIIILTHEIKDFMKIDKVMSIQNGEIMEFGKLEELEQDKSSYYNLFQGNKFLEEKGK
jgi:ABC-type transport system involved in cytochrome bd biosynthesis fused ATPase/permease subunit